MAFLRKFINSVFVLFGILCLGVLICSGILMIFPNTSIFGVFYVGESGETRVLSKEFDTVSEIDSVEIITINYPIIIESVESNYIEVFFRNNLKGYATSEIRKPELSVNLAEDNSSLNISLKEPEGWIFSRDAYIKVSVPLNVKLNNVVLATQAGTISVAEKENIEIDKLSITSMVANGNINIGKADIKNELNISNVSGRMVLDNNINANISINSKYGSFVFKNIGTQEVNNRLTVVGISPSITFDNLYGDFNFDTDSGLIKGDYIYGICNLESPNVEANINNMLNKLVVTDGIGSLNIKNLGIENDNINTTLITSNNGNVTIDKLNCKINLTANQGNIIIKEVYNDVTISNNYGTTDINVASENAVEVKIDSYSGTINAKNLNGITSIVSTNNSIINVSFKKVSGQCLISGGYQQLNVSVPILRFKLITKSFSGGVDVNVGSVSYNNWNVNEDNMVSSTENNQNIVTSYVAYNEDKTHSDYANNVLTLSTTSGKINVTTTTL